MPKRSKRPWAMLPADHWTQSWDSGVRIRMREVNTSHRGEEAVVVGPERLAALGYYALKVQGKHGAWFVFEPNHMTRLRDKP